MASAVRGSVPRISGRMRSQRGFSCSAPGFPRERGVVDGMPGRGVLRIENFLSIRCAKSLAHVILTIDVEDANSPPITVSTTG